MIDTKFRVFVLGAGCSHDCHYPLATEMAAHLREWANGLDPAKAPRLIQSVRDTLALMGPTTDTLDTLVWKIDGGHFDENQAMMGEQMMQKHQLRHRRIEAAKLVISAMFESREAAALDTGLSRYREFLSHIFPGAQSRWIGVTTTPCAVLTFNYDRLFEIAFQDRFRVDSKEWGFYGQRVLNSGLDVVYNNRVEFADDRFSFLKLHGSVGMWVQDDYGEARHGYSDPLAKRAPEPTDALFFPEIADQAKRKGTQAERLLVFPHERQGILDGDRGYLSRLYVQKVWERAAQLMARASEVFIIGYRFADIDREPFLRLLSHAKSCDEIVVQNPNADELCERLSRYHSEWKDRLTPSTLRF